MLLDVNEITMDKFIDYVVTSLEVYKSTIRDTLLQHVPVISQEYIENRTFELLIEDESWQQLCLEGGEAEIANRLKSFGYEIKLIKNHIVYYNKNILQIKKRK